MGSLSDTWACFKYLYGHDGMAKAGALTHELWHHRISGGFVIA